MFMRWRLERVSPRIRTLQVHVSATPQTFRDIEMVSATEGGVVGSAGTLLHTVDGGATWNSVATGMGDLYAVKVTDVSPVPEPETYAMLLAGLGVLGGVARRSSRTSATAGRR